MRIAIEDKVIEVVYIGLEYQFELSESPIPSTIYVVVKAFGYATDELNTIRLGKFDVNEVEERYRRAINYYNTYFRKPLFERGYVTLQGSSCFSILI